MPEILLRVIDKINTDFYLNCQCTKRGDVIAAQADGWNWGVEELANPDWRIIKFPIADTTQHDLMLAELRAMLSPEPELDPTHPSKTRQRRAFRLDLANLTIPLALRTYILDASRVQKFFTVPGTATTLRALAAGIKVARAPIADPAILGIASPAIIGKP